VILKGFKKCCIFNTVDEIDDDMLWSGSEEVGDGRSECEEYEGTECADGDSGTDW